jgi:hypothetical protein
MRNFRQFRCDEDTFYHRKIMPDDKGIDLSQLPADIQEAVGDAESFFAALDKGDLTLLPPEAKWLFICPLPVLTSPSTFLYFESDKGQHKSRELAELRLAEYLADYFQTILVNCAMKFLLDGITRNIQRGEIRTIPELQHAFISNIAAIFLPIKIMEDGNDYASTDELCADPSIYKLRIKIGKRNFEFIPAAMPEPRCESPKDGRAKRKNLGMASRYKSLGNLLSALYKQIETSFIATFEHGKHEGIKALLISLKHDLIGRISQGLYGDILILERKGKRAKQNFHDWKFYLKYQNTAFMYLRFLAEDEDGKLPVGNGERIPLKKAVDDCIRLVKWLQAGKPVCLNKISRDMEVYANAGALSQIVVNLLSNAKKNTLHPYSNIPIVIRAKRTRQDGKTGVLISVEDSGCGVRHEIRRLLFKEKGIHRDPLGRGKTEGGGFGLFLCGKSAEAHDGSMFYKPKRQRGSIFGCFFPDKT